MFVSRSSRKEEEVVRVGIYLCLKTLLSFEPSISHSIGIRRSSRVRLAAVEDHCDWNCCSEMFGSAELITAPTR